MRKPDFAYPLNPSSLGANSHDVAFNAAGTRGYSASLSSTLIFNTVEVFTGTNPISRLELPGGHDWVARRLSDDDAEISYQGGSTTGQIALRAVCGEDDKLVVHITNRPA